MQLTRSRDTFVGQHLDKLTHKDNRESFGHTHEISRLWGQLEKVLDWCKQELIGEWRWELCDVSTVSRPGRYVFYFDCERDYLAFVLWHS